MSAFFVSYTISYGRNPSHIRADRICGKEGIMLKRAAVSLQRNKRRRGFEEYTKLFPHVIIHEDTLNREIGYDKNDIRT